MPDDGPVEGIEAPDRERWSTAGSCRARACVAFDLNSKRQTTPNLSPKLSNTMPDNNPVPVFTPEDYKETFQVR
jgi:hypothetical protein